MEVSSARADSRGFTAVVCFGLLAGIGLRVYAHFSSLGTLDGDEAVWGLMARHFQLGELSAFFWGQGYGGTQEVLATVPLVALFGTSTEVVRAVPLVCTAIAALLVWRIGKRTVGEPAARIAAVFFWVWPPYLVWKSERAHGFYGSGLVFICLILLLVLRLAEATKPVRRSTSRPRARAGVVADPTSAPHSDPRARMAPLEAARDLARRMDRAADRRARRAPLADLQRRA